MQASAPNAVASAGWIAQFELEQIPVEVSYVGLLLALFVLPRVLLRIRIPRAITSLLLGIVVAYVFPAVAHDETVKQLATFGIVSLFLFAGLDVEFGALRAHAELFTWHLAMVLVTTAGFAWVAAAVFGMPTRPAVLVALALLTPSAGFILESVDALGASRSEHFWIRSTVIASELLALFLLFVVLRSQTWGEMAVATGALVAMIALLPVAFRSFATWILPYAPKSEFAFLIVIAVTCALVTKHLGVYYLVGAFVVGMAAQRFRRRLPAIASEKMIEAVEAFASVFVPFYFFGAGLSIEPGELGPAALGLGLLLCVIVIPLRWLAVGGLRRWLLHERWSAGRRIGVATTPTLVFTLVLAGILRERFDIPGALFGALILYAVVSTMVPTWLFHASPPEFDALQAPDLRIPEPAAPGSRLEP